MVFYLDATNVDYEPQEGHFEGIELTLFFLMESWIFKSLWKSLRTAQKLTRNQTGRDKVARKVQFSYKIQTRGKKKKKSKEEQGSMVRIDRSSKTG